MSLDHGVLNVPLSKRGGGSLEAQIDRALAEQRRADRERAAEYAAVAAVRAAAEKARRKFTADDLAGATAVRDRFGWHRVVRVSAKSVTVETPWSWDDRIALDRVLEVRR